MDSSKHGENSLTRDTYILANTLKRAHMLQFYDSLILHECQIHLFSDTAVIKALLSISPCTKGYICFCSKASAQVSDDNQEPGTARGLSCFHNASSKTTIARTEAVVLDMLSSTINGFRPLGHRKITALIDELLDTLFYLLVAKPLTVLNY